MCQLDDRSNMSFSSEWELEYNPNNCVLICKEKDFVIDYVPEHLVPQTMEMLRLLNRIYDTIRCSFQQLKMLFIQNILLIKSKGNL